MKITKFLHSCLVVEENDKKLLIDPGIYSYEAKVIDYDALGNLDYILITHEHPDHFHPPLVKELLAKFPDAKITTNSSVVELLKKENIESISVGNDLIEVEEVEHEHVFGMTEMPENFLFKIFGKLTHPGDSEHYELETDILALPVLAPWTNTSLAVERAVKLKPKVIIPIHDFLWTEEAREWMYGRFETYFKENGIDFKSVKTGEEIEV
ncbi:MAG TPA: MBL fold metallo-hydrolase [Candidatus Saccharimonadales bacterium]|nr:MBL fold metallo-hydrolase [Candidatus Saccharimonadales bacterium]